MEPRLFVAVPIAETARAAIEAIVEPIRAAEPAGRGVRWVRLDGLHVTLRFLGPTSEARLEDLAGAVRAAAASSGPFDVRIHGAGAFPSAGRPRTIWLAIHDGGDELAELAAALDTALVRAGWPPVERPFRAHLTLARADGVRRGPQTAEALRAAAAGLDVGSVADRIVVYESVTGGGPARYVARAEARLGDGASVLPSGRPRVGLRKRRQGAPHTS
jgi:2'-5' RNA ligase